MPTPETAFARLNSLLAKGTHFFEAYNRASEGLSQSGRITLLEKIKVTGPGSKPALRKEIEREIGVIQSSIALKEYTGRIKRGESHETAYRAATEHLGPGSRGTFNNFLKSRAGIVPSKPAKIMPMARPSPKRRMLR